MSIAVLGAAGQLGQALCRVLPAGVAALGRRHADLTTPIELRRVLEGIAPRVVFNAAGYTSVDRAEAEPSEAFAVNALGLRDLALICHDLDAVLIHFSTNYVFGLDASRVKAYAEDDRPGPVNVYGNSKLAGEHFVRDICPRHFIVRTCGLYGLASVPGGSTNFVRAMLEKARGQAPIRVVDDQVCTPTALADLAAAAVRLIDSTQYGLYHVTNAGACTWHEFAATIFALARLPAALVPIKSGEYQSAAHRPGYSVLDNARWSAAGFAPLRSWQEALAHALAQEPR